MLGYKLLRLTPDGSVRSNYDKYLWTAHGNRAECQVADANFYGTGNRKLPIDTPCPEPPGEDCACGIYVCTTLESVTKVPPGDHHTVTVLVELYGRVIEHEDGVLRAEWANLLALCAFTRRQWLDNYGVQVPDRNDPTFRPVQPQREDTTDAHLNRVATMLGLPYYMAETLADATLWYNEKVQQYADLMGNP